MGSHTPLVFVWCCAIAAAQDAPKVVSMEPAHLSEVDAKEQKQLVVTFDQAMSDQGWSFCGGGPQFPKIVGRPQWETPKKIVVTVELEPDHEYRLSLNCPAGTNFRSSKGVQLAPVPWSFVTLPEKVRPPAEQKRRNQRALQALTATLAERYSYYDLRVQDWKKLEKDNKDAILGARTDRGFAMAAAKMLQPTEDLHLYLRIGEQTFGTGSRAVDSLFRRKLVDRYVTVEPVGKQALAGRTEDGIGYLLIAAWTNDLDPELVGGAITALMDTKAMVIDVRPNSGGDESLAQQVAAWFVGGTRTYARHQIKQKKGKAGFGPVVERQLRGRGDEPQYDKPIAVLTSRYVMSSNESFVMMLQQAKDCVVVGQPTFGSSGNPQSFDLGNDVTVLVPSWRDLRLDGTPFEGEGLAPDEFVPCTAADLESRDPILERALELLRGKVGAGK